MSTADVKVLKIVKAVFESYQEDSEVDIYDALPKHVQNLIDKGLEDIKAGRTLSHEDVMSKVKKRYNIAG